MHPLRGTTWGPRPLPELLVEQLTAHGFERDGAAECARQINENPAPAAAASLFVDLGACNFLAGDIDGAIASWRHVITGEHDDAASRALLNLGLLYEHLHLHARAVSVLASVAERNVAPYVAPAVMAAARCHQAVGATGVAMETMARLAQSIMAHGSDTHELAEALYGLGDIAADAGRLDRAERAWRAASAAPTSTAQQAAVDRLLTLHLDQGHDEEVIDLLLAHQPAGVVTAHVPAVLARVEALQRLGSADQAAALVAMIDGARLGAGDRFRLADTRLLGGFINEAIGELEILLNDGDIDVQQRAAYSLGEIYRDHDMADAATTMYERVLDEGDDFWSPKAAIALGDICAESGDRERARAHWTSASASIVTAVGVVAHERLESAFAQAPIEDTPDRSLDALDEPVQLALAEPHRLESGLGTEAEPPGFLLDLLGEDVDGSAIDDAEMIDLALVDDEFDELIDLAAVDKGLVHLVSGEPALVTHEPIVPDPIEAVPVAHADVNNATEPDPQVIVLAALEVDARTAELGALDDGVDPHLDTASVAISATNSPTALTPPSAAAQPTASAFRNLSDPNPYAALAPEGKASDVAPSSRNPYAELAPNFDNVEFEPAEGVQPGDWESMLEDWPPSEPDPQTARKANKKRSSAFSRYT